MATNHTKKDGRNMPTQSQHRIPEKPRIIKPVPGGVSFTEGNRAKQLAEQRPGAVTAGTTNHQQHFQGFGPAEKC
jgi:hypothetical protein